jgi:hypothetical protein
MTVVHADSMTKVSSLVWPSSLGETRRAFRWDRFNGMVDLGFLPGFDVNFTRGSFAWDINILGQIVGYSFGTPGGQFGFLWDPAIQAMTPLGEVPGVGPVRTGSAINDNGQVAGIAGGGLGTRASITNMRTGSQQNLSCSMAFKTSLRRLCPR